MVATWAGDLGRPYAEMWTVTPRVFALVLQGACQRRKSQLVDGAQLAYIRERLHRTKKLPKIDEVVGWVTPEKPAKTERNTGLAEALYKRFQIYEAARKAQDD